jgi:hypothetical protein
MTRFNEAEGSTMLIPENSSIKKCGERDLKQLSPKFITINDYINPYDPKQRIFLDRVRKTRRSQTGVAINLLRPYRQHASGGQRTGGGRPEVGSR